jgi:flagellar biosynthetic protein FliR
MDIEAIAGAPVAYRFLLAFTRVAGMFLPLGLPGVQQTPPVARIVLAALMTLLLWPQWSAGGSPANPIGAFAGELGVGTLVGLAATVVVEALTMALHWVGLQSGYQYASTVDPSSQADSPVLPVLGQLAGFLLFLVLGGDHLLIRALARSFHLWPPGYVPNGWISAALLKQFAGSLFDTALRFALPLVALLVLVDLTMGVVTRAHSQLQLLTIAFPAKMLLALFTLSALLPVWTSLVGQQMTYAGGALGRLFPAY